jgi:hypothetical protein
VRCSASIYLIHNRSQGRALSRSRRPSNQHEAPRQLRERCNHRRKAQPLNAGHDTRQEPHNSPKASIVDEDVQAASSPSQLGSTVELRLHVGVERLGAGEVWQEDLKNGLCIERAIRNRLYLSVDSNSRLLTRTKVDI